jgi:hypothetical protein
MVNYYKNELPFIYAIYSEKQNETFYYESDVPEIIFEKIFNNYINQVNNQNIEDYKETNIDELIDIIRDNGYMIEQITPSGYYTLPII